MIPAVFQRLRNPLVLRFLVWVLLALLPIQYSAAAVAAVAEVHQAGASGSIASEVGNSTETADDFNADCAAHCGAACACACHDTAGALIAGVVPHQPIDNQFAPPERTRLAGRFFPHRIERPKWPRIA